MQVGAIHGRLLLAWSAAAILGPVLINYIRAYQIDTLQLPPAQVYSITMYIMASLLIVGLICNNLVKPLMKEHFREPDESFPVPGPLTSTIDEMTNQETGAKIDVRLLLAWLFVGIPMIWGVTQTLIKSLALF